MCIEEQIASDVMYNSTTKLTDSDYRSTEEYFMRKNILFNYGPNDKGYLFRNTRIEEPNEIARKIGYDMPEQNKAAYKPLDFNKHVMHSLLYSMN